MKQQNTLVQDQIHPYNA